MMSHDLPSRPSLDHLKKQARTRLRELHGTNPDAKLADAQHLIAQDYGFASWAKLKAYVEKIAESTRLSSTQAGRQADASDDHGFERYTARAKQALFFSRYEAAQLGNSTIEPEHVLLGLVRAGQGWAGALFERAQLTPELARTELPSPATAPEALPQSVIIPFGAETKRIFAGAKDEANRRRHRNIGVVHLLAGILRAEPSIAASILARKGLHLAVIRRDMDHLLNEGSS
jgi:hypothetical protein